MKNNMKKIITMLLVGALTLCLMGTALAAKRVDRRFVDSSDHTGYYVDVNSIKYEGLDELTVDVYIVKALFNTMYMYTTHFDMKEKSYQYEYTKIYQYDTKKVAVQSDVPSMKLGYSNGVAGNNRAMEQVLNFALQWHRSHLYKTNLGELLD